MLRDLYGAEGVALWMLVAGSLIVIAGTAISGHQLHRWLFYSVPSIGQRLPADSGAWAGLIIGILVLIY